jgi:hypothetical protein
LAKNAIEPLREFGPEAVLRVALASNLEQYNRGDIKNRTAAGIGGIIALMEFALSCGAASHALLNPVRELVSNPVRELVSTLDNAMLAEEKSEKVGRPRASTQRELLQEIVAVAASILMDDGMKEQEANKYLVRKLGQIGLKISHHTVGNWRSTVTANLPPNVGIPGKPDQPKTTATENPDVGLYLLRWRQWRTLGKLHVSARRLRWRQWRTLEKPHGSARRFVDRVLVPDMVSFRH